MYVLKIIKKIVKEKTGKIHWKGIFIRLLTFIKYCLSNYYLLCTILDVPGSRG
jgi:hypothetical protein